MTQEVEAQEEGEGEGGTHSSFAGQAFSWGGEKEDPWAGKHGMGCRTIPLQASGERTTEKHEVVQARAREDGADAPGGQEKGCECTALLPP